MNTQFCKVGKRIPNLNKVFSVKAIEDKKVQSVEVVYKSEPSTDLDVVS